MNLFQGTTSLIYSHYIIWGLESRDLCGSTEVQRSLHNTFLETAVKAVGVKCGETVTDGCCCSRCWWCIFRCHVLDLVSEVRRYGAKSTNTTLCFFNATGNLNV